MSEPYGEPDPDDHPEAVPRQAPPPERASPPPLDATTVRRHRAPPGHCADCAVPVTTPWCPACGQRAGTPPLGLAELLRQLLGALLDTDGRIWRTVRTLLLRPGRLTLDWALGRRARHVAPLRLYLVLNVLAFLVMATEAGIDPGFRLLPPEPAERVDARRGEVNAELNDFLVSIGYPRERVNATVERMLEHPAQTLGLLFERAPTMLALLLPVLATVLWVLYAIARVPWSVHLVGLAHLHANFFLVLLLAEGFGGIGLLLETFGPPTLGSRFGSALGWIVALYLGGYLFQWLRTLYGHGPGSALALTALITLLHAAGLALGFVGLLLATLWIEVMTGA